MAYTTINKPSDYFNTVTYTGDGASSKSVAVGFQPDFTWIKTRGAGAHSLFDVVRGGSASNWLGSNTTSAETDYSSIFSFGFEANGIDVGYISDGSLNGSSQTYVGWNWLAGGTASSNTDGDITSTVSANTTSGFSIVSFTGNGGSDQQVGHGLGTTPTLYITKDRTNASTNWHYHTTQIDGGMDFLLLNSTNAAASSSLTAPSSTTIRVGGTINTSSANFISYVFAEKKGFSKFGSFAGNGSNDGTFVYTGFKPAFVITKLSSGIGSWFLHDNKRNGYNGGNNYVYPNAADAELTTQLLDITSNGFKMRFSGGANSSGTSIYMAFAENPLVTSGGTPATAR